MKNITKQNLSKLSNGMVVAIIHNIYFNSKYVDELVETAHVFKVCGASVVVSPDSTSATGGKRRFKVTDSSNHSFRISRSDTDDFIAIPDDALELERMRQEATERQNAKVKSEKEKCERRDAERAETDAKHKAEVDGFWSYKGEEMWQQGINIETACGIARSINYPSRDAQGATATAMVFIHAVPSDCFGATEERIEVRVEMLTVRPNKDWQSRFCGVLTRARSFQVRGKKTEEKELRELARREAVWQLVERC